MMIFEAKYNITVDSTDVPVLIGGNNFKIYNVKRDCEMDDILTARAIDFWENHVKPRIPVAISSMNDWNNLHNKQLIEDDIKIDELNTIIDELSKLQANEKKIKNDIDKLKISIVEKMGNHKNLIINNEKVGSIITKNYMGWDFDALKNDNDVKNKYLTKPVQQAYFQLTKKKGN